MQLRISRNYENILTSLYNVISVMIAANGKKLIVLNPHKADGVNILMKKYLLVNFTAIEEKAANINEAIAQLKKIIENE